MPKTTQKQRWRALIEPIGGLFLLGLLLVNTQLLNPLATALIGAVFVAGFAAYYGMGIGLYSWGALFFGNLLWRGAILQQDLLLQLWQFDALMYWSGLLLVAAAIGAVTTARRERYDDQVYQNEQLQKDNQELTDTIATVVATKDALKAKLLAFDNQTAELFTLFKALDQVAPQFVPATMVQQLQKHLQASAVVVYQCDSAGRLHPVAKTARAFDAELSCHTPMFAAAIDTGAPSFHGEADPAAAPMIAAAVHVSGQLAYVIGIDVPMASLSSTHLSLLGWFTKILGARMETEALREAAYPEVPSADVLALVIEESEAQ